MINKLPSEIRSISLTISKYITEIYAELTCDFNPIHLDAEYAKNTQFGQPIAHGTLALNLLVRAIGLSDSEELRAGRIEVKFIKPTLMGEIISTHGKRSSDFPEQYSVWVENDRGIKVIDGILFLDAGARE